MTIHAQTYSSATSQSKKSPSPITVDQFTKSPLKISVQIWGNISRILRETKSCFRDWEWGGLHLPNKGKLGQGRTSAETTRKSKLHQSMFYCYTVTPNAISMTLQEVCCAIFPLILFASQTRVHLVYCIYRGYFIPFFQTSHLFKHHFFSSSCGITSLPALSAYCSQRVHFYLMQSSIFLSSFGNQHLSPLFSFGSTSQ